LLVAASLGGYFPEKKKTKIMRKEVLMDPTSCFVEAVPSEGFQEMELKRLKTLHWANTEVSGARSYVVFC
jgi:hypothetical protein